ncbi:aspartate/glutamate racemase family protein [Rothia dentocariosa]|uniref:aspartate/glutamate racemase family protein n=1 Tax=Rothia dentocariosa TaxID=2047 RepID=UPI003C7C1F56
MKTLGIIGGMSPESTTLYYRIINREVNRCLGGNHSADIVMHSVDFEEVVRLQKSGDWEDAGALLAASATKLEGAGAQLLLVATNTMHKVAPAIERATTIPLLHVVDATAIQRQGLQRVGLLGTTFTMSDGFYTERMAAQGIQTIVPDEPEQAETNRIIFEQLCLGRVEPEAVQYLQQVITGLKEQGAQGVILGCTELCLAVEADKTPLPVFDSTTIHALAAVEAVLAPPLPA